MATGSSQLLIAGTATWNAVINLVVPESHYVTANLTMAAVAASTARRSGVSPARCGLDRSRLGSGLRWGSVGAAAVATVTAAASRMGPTAPLFADERVNQEDVRYQTLIRIPLGTVLLEELLFRSALPSHLEPNAGLEVKSSLLFGLWHVLPTLETLRINSIDDQATRAGAVAAAVVATTVAGLGFSWLRRRSGSVVAPMLVHWAANGTAYLLAARRRP